MKVFKNEPLNGIIKQEKKEKDSEGSDKEKKKGAANGAVLKQEDQDSPLNWLADVALSSEDKKPCEVMEIAKPCRVGKDKHGYDTQSRTVLRVVGCSLWWWVSMAHQIKICRRGNGLVFPLDMCSLVLNAILRCYIPSVSA